MNRINLDSKDVFVSIRAYSDLEVSGYKHIYMLICTCLCK